MPITPEQASIYAQAILQKYVPSAPGSEEWALVCKDFGGKGTTCGYLAAFLLYALGYRGPLMNRGVPEDGIAYRPGANVSAVWNMGRLPVRRYDTNSVLEYGDIVFISNGPPITEHVLIFQQELTRDGKIYWRSADGGQEGNALKLCERERRDKILGPPDKGRRIMSYIPLKDLSYTREPLPVDPDSFRTCEYGTCGIFSEHEER